MNQGSDVCTAVTLPWSHLPSLRCSSLRGEHPAPSSLNTVNGPDPFLSLGIPESSLPPATRLAQVPATASHLPVTVCLRGCLASLAWSCLQKHLGRILQGLLLSWRTGAGAGVGGGARVSGSFHGHLTLLDMFTHRLSGKVRILPNGCFTQLNN